MAHRPEKTGIRAACANGHHHVAFVAKYDGLAGGEIGCDDGQRGCHVFKAVLFQEALEERYHAIASGKSEPTEGPTRDIAETHGAGDGLDVIDPAAGRVSRRDHRALADARYVRDRYFGCVQNAYDA